MTSVLHEAEGGAAALALAPAAAELLGIAPRWSGMIRWVASKSRTTLLAVGFVLIVLIGGFDYYTGSQISVSLLYLLPILFVTHFSGRGPGLIAALLATGMWLEVNG